MSNPRTIFYTGKGGVGKTSVAAATAIRAAQAGAETLVVSTDPAHSLADSLGVAVGPQPVEVGPRLHAQEVEARREMERNWGEVRRWMVDAIGRQGVSDIAAEELTVPPGADELFNLFEVERHHREGRYDVIVVDCAPTGETLRLLSFPEVARWWLDRVAPREGVLLAAARPFARTLLEVDLPGPDVFAQVHALVGRLVAMNAVLRDREASSIRLVVNPDRMVVAETRRTFTYLSLYGFPTDAVVVNRVFPEQASDGYFGAWRERQLAELDEIRNGFAELEVLTGRYFDREVIGEELLRELGDELFGGLDPTAVLSDGGGEVFGEVDGAPVVRLRLPFASRESLDLKRNGGELIVSAGRERRTLILPPALARRDVASADLREGTLEIRFADDREPGTAGPPAPAAEQRSPATTGG
ncbi:ArsA family ATPase [Thermoleophilia bacterium SCSIO 60948]|nr:ArsA family ATPase [Thermoleophilia bacterium SCSIO 60948]